MAIAPRQAPQLRPPVIGAAQPSPALDPSGLVPVDRTQPVATDGAEAQRLMERRLGSMPPSSFSGAGAGFVPVDRPGVGQYADRMTAMANMEQFAKPEIMPSLSGEAQRQIAMSQTLGAPRSPRADAAREVMKVGGAAVNTGREAKDAVKATRTAAQDLRRTARDEAMDVRRAATAQNRQERQATNTLRRTTLQEKLGEMMRRRGQGQGQGAPAGGLLGIQRGM